jgi:heptosyltransferase-1
VRLLIVKLSSIGDVVHTLPAVALLKRTLPDARISWVVERWAASILQDSPAIDELIEIDSRAWRKEPGRRSTMAEVRSAFRSLRADVEVAVDFQGLIKSGVITWLSGAERRVGFETAELREPVSKLFLTHQVRTSGLGHVIRKNIALAQDVILKLTGQTADHPRFEFPIAISEQDKRYVSARVREIGQRFAIINPGGGWPTKRWPNREYSAIADYLWQAHSLPSFITYGPGEEAMASEIASMVTTDAARPLASTLKQFVALARSATIFIGGDTGPLHLAAASGTPIVGLYGPTSALRNGPFDPRDISVGRDLWCRAGCHQRRCWHWECMRIPVEQVADAVTRRLTDRVDVQNKD